MNHPKDPRHFVWSNWSGTFVYFCRSKKHWRMTGVCFEIGEASRTANIIENNFRSMLFHTLGILDPPMEGFEPDSRVRDLKIACFEGPMILRASAGKVVGVEVGI